MPLTTRFIDPFTDYGFKRLFGTEANKELLIAFLNLFLPQKHQITALRYARNEFSGLNEMDRKAVFDLYCIAQNGDRFIVELQQARQVFFKDRSVFYSSYPIQEQGQVGRWNFELQSVYMIAVLDFILTDNADVVSTVQLKDQHNQVFYDKLTYIYMEMPKFTKAEDQLETQSDKWLYILKYLPHLYERPDWIQERILNNLFDAAEVANLSRSERSHYEESLRTYRDLENTLSYSEEKGLRRGMEKGMAKGMEKGIEKGQRDQQLATARKALEAGLSTAIIATLTGLAEKEIRDLMND